MPSPHLPHSCPCDLLPSYPSALLRSCAPALLTSFPHDRVPSSTALSPHHGKTPPPRTVLLFLLFCQFHSTKPFIPIHPHRSTLLRSCTQLGLSSPPLLVSRIPPGLHLDVVEKAAPQQRLDLSEPLAWTVSKIWSIEPFTLTLAVTDSAGIAGIGENWSTEPLLPYTPPSVSPGWHLGRRQSARPRPSLLPSPSQIPPGLRLGRRQPA